MENNKGFKIVAIVALCISIIGVSVAFAALSQDLTVNGNGVVDSANWNVHFANLQGLATEKNGIVESEPSLSTDQKTLFYDFILTAPGDSISFTFDVVNTGDLDAILTGVTGTNKEVWTYDAVVYSETEGKYVTDTRTDAENDKTLVKNNLEFKLVYTDDDSEPADGNELVATTGSRTLRLTVTYKPDATEIPTGAVQVTPDDIVFNYRQNNK